MFIKARDQLKNYINYITSSSI